MTTSNDINWFDRFAIEMKHLAKDNKRVMKVIDLFEKFEEKGRHNVTDSEVEILESLITAIRLDKKEEFMLFQFYNPRVKTLTEIAEMTGFVQHNFNKKLKLYKNKQRELRSELGPYLKRLRKNLGLTLEDVKKLSTSNISTSYISRIENTLRPSPSLAMLQDLSRIYQTPLKEILDVAGIAVQENEIEILDTPYEIDEILYKFKVTHKGKELSNEEKSQLVKLIQSLLDSNPTSIEGTVEVLELFNNLIENKQIN